MITNDLLAISASGYDSTLGLKTQADFYKQDPNNSANWTGDYQELYQYDSALDYLTGASYNGGSSYTTWGYDAAGNRTSDSSNSGTWTYDNLNRMTASPGYTYTNSTTGSRLTRKVSGTTETAYTWDVLDRMTKTVQGSTTINYSYRADGLRYKKAIAGGAATKYRYDGQMPVEEMVGSGGTTTRFGNGARGMDYMLAGTAVSFPIYDGHGNMVATIARNGTGYTLANQRKYDVWGSVRSGSSTGDPKQRHCANLGHVQDDDTGLIYMRARYHEAETGRFISQDPDRDGSNWYTYCCSDPINYVDETGKFHWALTWEGSFGVFCKAMCTTLVIVAWAFAALKEPAAAMAAMSNAAVFAAGSLSGTDIDGGSKALLTAFRILSTSSILKSIVGGIFAGMSAAAQSRLVNLIFVTSCTTYSLSILGALIWCQESE